MQLCLVPISTMSTTHSDITSIGPRHAVHPGEQKVSHWPNWCSDVWSVQGSEMVEDGRSALYRFARSSAICSPSCGFALMTACSSSSRSAFKIIQRDDSIDCPLRALEFANTSDSPTNATIKAALIVCRVLRFWLTTGARMARTEVVYGVPSASLFQRGHISLYVPAPVSIGSECTVEGVSRALLGAFACMTLSAPLGGRPVG